MFWCKRAARSLAHNPLPVLLPAGRIARFTTSDASFMNKATIKVEQFKLFGI
jgi:hypothetical protein